MITYGEMIAALRAHIRFLRDKNKDHQKKIRENMEMIRQERQSIKNLEEERKQRMIQANLKEDEHGL